MNLLYPKGVNALCGRLATAVSLGLVLLAVWTGCKSRGVHQPEPGSGQGIAEYREIASGAQRAITAALDTVALVSAQTNRCSPAALSALSDVVHRLQVDSLQVRARTKAMEERGDEYFKNWHNLMVQVKDPQVKALAEEHRPELEAGFRRIKALSEEGREAFGGFLAGLRQLRNDLEKDPATVQADATRASMAKADQNGQRLQKCIGGIIHELDLMSHRITPAGKTNVK